MQPCTSWMKRQSFFMPRYCICRVPLDSEISAMVQSYQSWGICWYRKARMIFLYKSMRNSLWCQFTEQGHVSSIKSTEITLNASLLRTSFCALHTFLSHSNTPMIRNSEIFPSQRWIVTLAYIQPSLPFILSQKGCPQAYLKWRWFEITS